MGSASFERDYFRKVYGNDYARRNPARKIDYCLARIREVRPSGTLLDVGCAYGLFLSRARRYYDVTGCDVSEHAVGVAKKRFPDLDIFRAGIGDLPSGRAFNIITAFDVLEHIADPLRAMTELSSHLGEGGVLALTIPVYDGLPGWIARLLDRDDTHLRKENRRFWRETLKSAGYDIVVDEGLWRYLVPGVGYLFFGGRAWRDFSPALFLIGRKR
jgi:2-polyprenyl-3-methyl-5-hydroxy-6-metoxy-1,4-benzoquinol methylase